MSEIAICQLCGEPMPLGEEMFNYHGYSGPCPEAPSKNDPSGTDEDGNVWTICWDADRWRFTYKAKGIANAEIPDPINALVALRGDSQDSTDTSEDGAGPEVDNTNASKGE